jgi:glycosyltransferase 2 family protein
MTSWRTKATSFAKIGIGLLLLAYVFRSGMIDFAVLRTVLSHPSNVLVGLLFLGFCAVLSSLRWYFLVRAQGLALSVKNLLELTMIGNFFNTFMPGAVGGDLIKAWYVAGREPTRKTKAIFTVLLDRVIGLGVFFLSAAVTLAIHFEWLNVRLELRMLAYSIWAVTAGLALTALVFFSPFTSRLAVAHWVLQRLRRHQKVANLLDAALLYRKRLPIIALALVISCLSIASNVLLFKIQGDIIGIPLTMSQYFFVIPVALTVSAVPLLPGGIGVGQVAFFTLFQWIGLPDPSQGSTLCTVVQIYTILFNCIGAIFYVRFKRKPGVSLDALSSAMK